MLVCVVLGLSHAVDGSGTTSVAAADPLARLQKGQVAVPVSLTQTGTDGILRAGQRVGLLASTADSSTGKPSASLIADHLLVLRVSGVPPSGDGTASILVAAERPIALRIARASGQTVLAVLDKSS